jgi:hypothetical protein
LTSLCLPAVAQAKMVSASDCLALTPDCMCDDGAYMSIYLANQEAALSAWEDTQSDILDGGAKTFEDARALFNSKFMGDPAVLARFSSCPNFDPKKIAGDSILSGGAEIDDCFCKNACKDIVEATIAHERTHVAFNILGISYIIGVGTACKLNLTDPGFCSISEALLLSESEIQAHQRGNQVLSDALDNLKDPKAPDMQCTWEPLPPSSPREIPPPQPAGFFARFRTLFTRFVHGADAAAP